MALSWRIAQSADWPEMIREGLAKSPVYTGTGGDVEGDLRRRCCTRLVGRLGWNDALLQQKKVQ